ncbi:MAG: glycosyltransferase [Lachnospiraceae bacterium]|nr:glycosyltransferase [Lachnospiraceae bacterium]
MLPISVCIITKNEEKFLETCLKKLSRYSWEIVVTDTGSTDKTQEIAKRYAHQVHHFDWCNDFSAARNYCVSKASHDWILSVDSDEYLMNEEPENQLITILAPCLKHPESIGLIHQINPFVSGGQKSTAIEPIGRFFHRKHYQYTGIIHEQLLAPDGSAASHFDTKIKVYHEGYANPDTLTQKSQRNIQLLETALLAHPDDPYLYYQLGQSYFVLNDYERACSVFQKGLAFDVNPNLQYVRTMVESYGHCLLSLKKYQEALTFEGIYEAFSSHADFLFLMGLIYMNNGLFEDAINQFLLAARTEDHSVLGINSYLPYYNIGVIYECLGSTREALSYYKKCGDYAAAKEGIKRVKTST